MAPDDQTDEAADPAREGRPSRSSGAVTSVADSVTAALADPTAAARTNPSPLVAPRPLGHRGVAERRDRGREGRAETPRGQLAVWAPGAGRSDPVELLLGQAVNRSRLQWGGAPAFDHVFEADIDPLTAVVTLVARVILRDRPEPRSRYNDMPPTLLVQRQ